jgi:hypothetical protein
MLERTSVREPLINISSHIVENKSMELIGFARRFANLLNVLRFLFRDMDRLARIVNNPVKPGFSFIYAGKLIS